jgi:DNA-binding GntR family transcriptional regulator
VYEALVAGERDRAAELIDSHIDSAWAERRELQPRT